MRSVFDAVVAAFKARKPASRFSNEALSRISPGINRATSSFICKCVPLLLFSTSMLASSKFQVLQQDPIAERGDGFSPWAETVPGDRCSMIGSRMLEYGFVRGKLPFE